MYNTFIFYIRIKKKIYIYKIILICFTKWKSIFEIIMKCQIIKKNYSTQYFSLLSIFIYNRNSPDKYLIIFVWYMGCCDLHTDYLDYQSVWMVHYYRQYCNFSNHVHHHFENYLNKKGREVTI